MDCSVLVSWTNCIHHLMALNHKWNQLDAPNARVEATSAALVALISPKFNLFRQLKHCLCYLRDHSMWSYHGTYLFVHTTDILSQIRKVICNSCIIHESINLSCSNLYVGNAYLLLMMFSGSPFPILEAVKNCA